MEPPKAEFDSYAEGYEELLRDPIRDRFVQASNFFHRRKWILISEFLSRYALAPSDMAWLDVGCGKGELLTYGSSHFRRAAGCDPSREMVRNASGFEVYFQDALANLPFADGSFDFVTAACVYHHVEEANRIPLTREIHRVLRPSGILCIIEHNPFNPVTQLIVGRTPVDSSAHLLTCRRARRYAHKAGLHHMESQYFLYLPERYYGGFGGLESLLRKIPLGGQYTVFSKKQKR